MSRVTKSLYSGRTVCCKRNIPSSHPSTRPQSELASYKFWNRIAGALNVTVSWDFVIYRLVEVYRRFRLTCCRHHQGMYSDTGPRRSSETSVQFNYDEEGRKFLQNACTFLPDYTASQNRRQQNSVSRRSKAQSSKKYNAMCI